MSLIEYMLDNFNRPMDFEHMCCQILHKSGYLDINPMGGTNDKGRDATETLYENSGDGRKIVFQFSLQKDIKAKVEGTLERLREAGIPVHQLVCVFSTRVGATQIERLSEAALRQYGIELDIKDQRYLLIRLESEAYKDVFGKYFAEEINKIQALAARGEIFISDTSMTENERRCLINLMFYSRHALAGDIRAQVIGQTIFSVLSESETPIKRAELLGTVRAQLPSTITTGDIDAAMSTVKRSGAVRETPDGRCSLASIQADSMKADTAELYMAQKAFHEFAHGICVRTPGYSLAYTTTSAVVDKVLCELFRLYGHEVANVILNPTNEDANGEALDIESVDTVLAQVTGSLDPIDGKVICDTLRGLLLKPPAQSIAYLSALSTSYICMQLLNANPDAVELQRRRLKDSMVVLDTDVLLTGIVMGARSRPLAIGLVQMCQKAGIPFFAFTDSIEELVFRIKRSVQIYEDLGRPNMIPMDKRDLIHDLFLDVYFERVATGEALSFEAFMERYYDPENPSEHIRALLYRELHVECESKDKYYLIPQERKIVEIQKIIEDSRQKTLSYKHAQLYYKDAKAMVVIEQQNRAKIGDGLLGRWYLVSSDKHILNAYIKKKDSFKVKPCVLPRHFIELLHQMPENVAGFSTFGAVLQSEALLKGPGKNYTSVIASLTRLGVKALEYSREQLLEIIDQMERADFTRWLIKLRGYDNLPDKFKEELRQSLEHLFDESASRSEIMESLEKKQIPSV